MERLVTRRQEGLTAAGLRKFGLVFLLAGICSRAILQNKVLGMASGGTEQLMALFDANPDMMGVAALALVLQALETCAAPIFAFLLVEGFSHPAQSKDYFLKIIGVALAAEIPYNLAMGGKLLDLSGRNPAFGLVFGYIMMHYFCRYSDKGFKNVLTKVLIAAAAIVWCMMLNIEYGACIILLVASFWMGRNKPNLRTLFGCSGAVICTAFSMFFLASPMALMAVHFYNGEPGEQSEFMRYWTYPAVLLLVGIGATMLL